MAAISPDASNDLGVSPNDVVKLSSGNGRQYKLATLQEAFAAASAGALGISTVATKAALNALAVPADGGIVYMKGYYATNDGGEGFFVYSASSVLSNNNGTIIIPNSGVGRWLRVNPQRGTYNIRWYGAKGDNATDDTAAIDAAILEARTYIGNSEVYIPPGVFKTNGHAFSYVDVRIRGLDSGTCRLAHINGNFKPILYITGGGYNTAVPYAGVTGVTLVAGDMTFPAMQYYDQQIDNQVKMDDVSYQSITSGVNAAAVFCDGLSIFDFLNFNKAQFRCDSVGGYGIRVRGDSCISTRGASTLSGAQSYKVTTPVDLVTGKFTYNAGQAELIPGTGVMVFTSGTMPTPNTGAAMTGGQGDAYFAGVGTDETGIVLYRNRVDAKAGTNPITYSAAQVGNLSFAPFPATFDLTAVNTGASTLTYLNDKNIIIPTSTQDGGGKTTVYGSGYANTFTLGGAGNVGALHAVFLYSDGALPTGLTQGTAYYPIYVDARTIKLATSYANANAGTAIALSDAGSGNIAILYDHQVSRLGVGAMIIEACTYDNVNSATAETINGVATGGLGMFYMDNSNFLYKGTVSFKGNRYEINKTLAADRVYGNGKRAFFRVEVGWGNRTSASNGGPPSVQLSLHNMGIEYAVGLQGASLRLVGNRGNADLAPFFDDVALNNVGQAYNNDNGTARSSTPVYGAGGRTAISQSTGDCTAGSSAGLLNGTYYSAVQGILNSPMLLSVASSAIVKGGDTPYALDTTAAFYKAVQTTVGYCKGTGATSAGTVTGTAGSAVFTLAALSGNGVGIGTAVKIPGAGVAAADLVGIIKDVDNIAATKTITLGDPATGLDLPASTDVTGVTMTFMPAIFAGVYPEYRVTGALNFGSISAQSHLDLTINAPANVTFRSGAACRLGAVSITTGVIFTAFVTSGGASVTVRACNYTGGAIDPASITFTVFVEV